MLYAPDISSLGLDMVRKASREQVFAKEKKMSLALMNKPAPWYPEAVGYNVCYIESGK